MYPRVRILACLLTVTCLGLYLLVVVSHPLFSQTQTRLAGAQQLTGSFLISMERTGGYAGAHEKFSVYPDGRITNAAGQTQQISSQALEEIRRRVAALDVPKSCEIRVSGSLCSDCFQYRIVLTGPSGTRTLVLEDPMADSDSVSKIAKDIRNLVLGLKWK